MKQRRTKHSCILFLKWRREEEERNEKTEITKNIITYPLMKNHNIIMKLEQKREEEDTRKMSEYKSTFISIYKYYKDM